jgi:hypothetical protein
MLPLFFLVLAILLTPQFGLGGHWIYVVLGLAQVTLLVTGVDRRHKYSMEVEGLIAGAFLKICGQNEKSAADKSDKSVASQITHALKAATIIEKTGLTIVPGEPQAPAPVAPSATSGQAPAPAKPDTTQKPAPSAKTDNPPDTGSK